MKNIILKTLLLVFCAFSIAAQSKVTFMELKKEINTEFASKMNLVFQPFEKDRIRIL